MKKQALDLFIAKNWKDYELLDSGDGLKLERFGEYKFIRPEAQAIWQKSNAPIWKDSDAEFKTSGIRGAWEFYKKIPKRFELSYKDIKFYSEPTPFRHMGFFPEQSSHWDFIADKIKNAGRPIKVLNLFGYTGLASLVAAQAGASVTHVDASKVAITWARENQELSNIPKDTIRWIPDDALKFIQKEIKRGEKYDAIMIDPPKHGRGPKGEVWKIEENLSELLDACGKALSDNPLFFIATLYAVDFSAIGLGQAVSCAMSGKNFDIENGELALPEGDKRVLSLAITSRVFFK